MEGTKEKNKKNAITNTKNETCHMALKYFFLTYIYIFKESAPRPILSGSCDVRHFEC